MDLKGQMKRPGAVGVPQGSGSGPLLVLSHSSILGV